MCDAETENRMKLLFRETGLGELTDETMPVSGGFMHRMYRVRTEHGVFAVKELSAEVMERPSARANFARAEAYEKELEDAGVRIVPALTINGRKMQNAGGRFYYIFRWFDGQVTDWHHITAEQCREAGKLLGKIHAIRSEKADNVTAEPKTTDWHGLCTEAVISGSPIADALKENEALFVRAEEERAAAYSHLPGIRSITDGDMDPKNVMWSGGEGYVIDLECLDLGNPAEDALILSLQWAGAAMRMLDPAKLRAFFGGYLSVYDNGFRGYDEIFGLCYSWTDWLSYNVKRALGMASDEQERNVGITETLETVRRIRYLSGHAAEIREILKTL